MSLRTAGGSLMRPDPVDLVPCPTDFPAQLYCVPVCRSMWNARKRHAHFLPQVICATWKHHKRVCVCVCVLEIINLLPCCTILSPFGKVTAAFSDADAQKRNKKHFQMFHNGWLRSPCLTYCEEEEEDEDNPNPFLMYSSTNPIVITYFNTTRPSGHCKWLSFNHHYQHIFAAE